LGSSDSKSVFNKNIKMKFGKMVSAGYMLPLLYGQLSTYTYNVEYFTALAAWSMKWRRLSLRSYESKA
jgi:hypothetical protein